jgi:hypothetical protein
MIDAIYVLVSLGFFGLMLAYVKVCDRLGHTPGTDADRTQEDDR